MPRQTSTGMQTIADIGQARNISETSARVAVRRAYEKLDLKMPKELSNTDPLPDFILELIQTKGAKVAKLNGNAAKAAEAKPAQEAQRPKLPGTPQGDLKPAVELEVVPVELPEKKERRARALPEPEKKGINWTAVLSILPLPMLGLAASFGVYFFSKRFVPEWVAIGEAMAFELTYIGLAASRAISGAKYERARWVSMAAVAVSVIYNTLAAALHLHPEVLDILKPTQNGFWPGVGFWVVSMLHGAPLAILGFFISELGFVKQD
jgi:hypothetical protein